MKIIDNITIDDYRHVIIKPINPQATAGTKLNEDPHFDFIEAQLMKIGSLTHEEIEWSKVEQAALKILMSKSKDLKVAGYLIQCLQYQASPERFILSINILADFVQHFWLNSYPFIGEKGNISRQRLLNQIIQRTGKAFAQTSFSMFNVLDKQNLEDAINYLKQSCYQFEIPDIEIEKLSNSFIRVATTSEIIHKDHSSQTQNIHPRTEVNIDTSDNRALKKTIIQISDFFLELNQKQLSIQIKRLALWHTIHAAPPHKADNETELAGISIDKIAEYKEQLNNPSDDLWKKLEQSIFLSPFWIDGHYISYQMAKKLGYSDVSITIKQCVMDFIHRIPSLCSLKFKGGLPFVSEETQIWLDQNEIVIPANNCSNNQFKDTQQQANEILEKQGISEALLFLNTGLENASNLREQIYLKIVLAEI